MTGIELDDGLATADRFRVASGPASARWWRSPCTRPQAHRPAECWPRRAPVSRLADQVGPVALGPLKPGTTRS